MLTYSSESPDPGGSTFGGYATQIVVSEAFVLRIPEHLDPAAAAPLLCAGITTFSPLQYWRVGAGQKVGVIGLGGLGHMGIKFARAMGAQVVMITRSADKQKDAQHLGAHEVLLSNDDAAMAEHAGSFDFLLDTIPVEHDVNPYLKLLKHSATLCIVGAVGPIGVVDTANLVLARRNIAGSMIGGIAETQQMLDFCGEHQLTAEVEVIDINTINQAYQRMQRSDVKYRFVIDMATLSKS